MVALELTEPETGALLLLVKLGMDTYKGETVEEVLEALVRVPNPVLDRLFAKLSLAGSAALKGDSNGRTVPHG